MGRRFTVAVIASGALAGFVNLAIAQGPPPMPRHRSAMREQWHAMSPEDRQRFRSNAERWLGLPPEERHALRMQEAIRRERLRRDAEAAMRDSGLDLEAERRAQFEQRYFEERRRIDRALRQEIQERRQRELAPVLDELRREFAQPGGTTVPANVRSASPGPTK